MLIIHFLKFFQTCLKVTILKWHCISIDKSYKYTFTSTENLMIYYNHKVISTKSFAGVNPSTYHKLVKFYMLTKLAFFYYDESNWFPMASSPLTVVSEWVSERIVKFLSFGNFFIQRPKKTQWGIVKSGKTP